jgi:hypothetical protein
MNHHKLTYQDIMQSNILYYDSESEAACMDICNYLQIDNMPALDGMHFYELRERTFHVEKIKEAHKVNTNDYLFSRECIDKFTENKHNVLFVFEENVIRGVVHISDFNRNIVLQAIQDDMLSYERNLRQLILLSGFRNENMRGYFEYKLEKEKNPKTRETYQYKIQNFENRLSEINSLGQFQAFDFSDIMSFASSKFSNGIHVTGKFKIGGIPTSGSEVLRELRNLAMHGKNPITINKESSIYSIDSLEMLLESLRVLCIEQAQVSYKIRKHPDLLRSLELENRSKLEIIHMHHPKALEYFLG